MKSFQVRSREVRAASQRLMRELRESRMASSRLRPLEKPKTDAPLQAAIPARTTTLLPSRKILAAEAAPVPPNVKPEKVRMAKADETLAAVQSAAPVHPKKPKVIKAVKIGTKAAEANTTEVPGSIPAAPQPISDGKAPEPAKKQPKSARPKAVQSKTSTTVSKAKADVAAIIADGMAPIAALQQVVAASLAAKAGAPLSVGVVPSLGPGMVWRLNQLGLRTLGDLAAADANDLRQKLGKLGRMVNVEQWIAYARAA